VDESTFELVAASLRADSADIHSFVEVLASKLSAAFPGMVEVERERGFGRRQRPVRRIALSFPDRRFVLEAGAAGATCSESTIVRGIALKTDQLALDAWLDGVSRAVAEHAHESEQGRAALERLLL
jgi:hypothetical protein